MKLIKYLVLLFLIPINYGYAEYTPSILTPDSLDYGLYGNLVNFIDNIPALYTAVKEFVSQSIKNTFYGDIQNNAHEFKADYSFGKTKLGEANLVSQLTVDSPDYLSDSEGYFGDNSGSTAAPESPIGSISLVASMLSVLAIWGMKMRKNKTLVTN